MTRSCVTLPADLQERWLAVSFGGPQRRGDQLRGLHILASKAQMEPELDHLVPGARRMRVHAFRKETEDFEMAWDSKCLVASLSAKVAPSLHSRDNLLPPHARSLVALWKLGPHLNLIPPVQSWRGAEVGWTVVDGLSPAPSVNFCTSDSLRASAASEKWEWQWGPWPVRGPPLRTREVAGSCDPREAPDTDCRNCSETRLNRFSR